MKTESKKLLSKCFLLWLQSQVGGSYVKKKVLAFCESFCRSHIYCSSEAHLILSQNILLLYSPNCQLYSFALLLQKQFPSGLVLAMEGHGKYKIIAGLEERGHTLSKLDQMPKCFQPVLLWFLAFADFLHFIS